MESTVVALDTARVNDWWQPFTQAKISTEACEPETPPLTKAGVADQNPAGLTLGRDVQIDKAASRGNPRPTDDIDATTGIRLLAVDRPE